MRFVTSITGLLAAAGQSWLAAALPQFPDNPVCPAGITSVEVQPVQFIVRQPIFISAFLPVNTVLVLDDGLTLTITNAPMTLVTEIDKLGTMTSQVTRILQQVYSSPNAYVTITRGGQSGSLASTITVFPSGPDGVGTYLVYTPYGGIAAPTAGGVVGSPAATFDGTPIDATRPLNGNPTSPALNGAPGGIPGASPASIPLTVSPTGSGAAGPLPQLFNGPLKTVTIGGAEGVPRNLTVVDSAKSEGTVFVQTFDSYSITVTGPQNVITVLGNAGVTPAAVTLPDARVALQTLADTGALQIIQTPGGGADFLARMATVTIGNTNGQAGTFTLIPTSGSVGAVVVQTPVAALGSLFQTLRVPGATDTTISIPAPEGSTGTVVIQTKDGFTGPAAGPFTTVNVGGGQGGTPATVTIPPAAGDPNSAFRVL
ncbi:hypothetical protein LZ30DRAFT_582784, partial [Colletotrichum cereale]